MMVEIESLMNNVGTTSLLLGISMVACLVSLLMVFLSHKKTKKVNAKLLRLEHDLQIAQGSAIGMGQQLIMLEKKLNQRGSDKVKPHTSHVHTQTAQASDSIKVNQRQTSAVNENDSIYDDARQLLSDGVDVAGVAKQCGLSFAEVSLLQSLSKSTISSH